MVPLALFSDIVPKLELQYLAERLLEVQPGGNVTLPIDRYGTGFGKPKFPNDNISAATKLADLVSSDSWFIFRLMGIETNFLSEDVDRWPGEQSFLSSKAKTSALNVINDNAKSGVKLSSDYLDTARSEEQYQNILQIVEESRNQLPNLRNRKSPADSDN